VSTWVDSIAAVNYIKKINCDPEVCCPVEISVDSGSPTLESELVVDHSMEKEIFVGFVLTTNRLVLIDINVALIVDFEERELVGWLTETTVELVEMNS